MGYVGRAVLDKAMICARIEWPQDVYDAVNLIHTDCIDELGEDHPMTQAMGEALTLVQMAYTACPRDEKPLLSPRGE